MAPMRSATGRCSNFATGIASGAGWMSFHHGGGVGMGYSQHSGLVAVADGSDEAEQRLRLCLTNDPAMGVIRHADAGYRARQGRGTRARRRHAVARGGDRNLPGRFQR